MARLGLKQRRILGLWPHQTARTQDWKTRTCYQLVGQNSSPPLIFQHYTVQKILDHRAEYYCDNQSVILMNLRKNKQCTRTNLVSATAALPACVGIFQRLHALLRGDFGVLTTIFGLSLTCSMLCLPYLMLSSVHCSSQTRFNPTAKTLPITITLIILCSNSMLLKLK